MTTDRKNFFVKRAYIRAILLFCLFSIGAALWFRSIPRVENYDQKRAIIRTKMLQDLAVDDEKKLNHYAWIDQKKGATQIPLHRAEEIVIAELKTKNAKPTAVKVEVPYPSGLQQAPSPLPQEVKK